MINSEFLHTAISLRTDILFRNIDELITSGSLKSIHGTRVSARRLRSVLEGLTYSGYYPAQLCSHLKNLVKLTGTARELSVCISITGEYSDCALVQSFFLNDFRKYLDSLFGKEKEILLGHYELILFPEKKKEFMCLPDYSPSLPEELSDISDSALNGLFRSIVIAHLEKIQCGFDISLSRDKFRKLHQARIEAKSLRYIIELFNETDEKVFNHELSAVKSFVDISGTTHDYNVLISYLNKYLKVKKGKHRTPAHDNSLKSFGKYIKLKESDFYNESVKVMNIFLKDEFRLELLKKISPDFP